MERWDKEVWSQPSVCVTWRCAFLAPTSGSKGRSCSANFVQFCNVCNVLQCLQFCNVCKSILFYHLMRSTGLWLAQGALILLWVLRKPRSPWLESRAKFWVEKELLLSLPLVQHVILFLRHPESILTSIAVPGHWQRSRLPCFYLWHALGGSQCFGYCRCERWKWGFGGFPGSRVACDCKDLDTMGEETLHFCVSAPSDSKQGLYIRSPTSKSIIS